MCLPLGDQYADIDHTLLQISVPTRCPRISFSKARIGLPLRFTSGDHRKNASTLERLACTACASGIHRVLLTPRVLAHKSWASHATQHTVNIAAEFAKHDAHGCPSPYATTWPLSWANAEQQQAPTYAHKRNNCTSQTDHLTFARQLACKQQRANNACPSRHKRPT